MVLTSIPLHHLVLGAAVQPPEPRDGQVRLAVVAEMLVCRLVAEAISLHVRLGRKLGGFEVEDAHGDGLHDAEEVG